MHTFFQINNGRGPVTLTKNEAAAYLLLDGDPFALNELELTAGAFQSLTEFEGY